MLRIPISIPKPPILKLNPNRGCAACHRLLNAETRVQSQNRAYDICKTPYFIVNLLPMLKSFKIDSIVKYSKEGSNQSVMISIVLGYFL
jgi:hypothetical protein